MMTILNKYLQKFMAVFVDDFIVYSSTTEHLACLRLVLKRCHEKKVSLNAFKCFIGADKGEVLGHVVSNKGIEITDAKIKAILEAKAPQNVNEVASFLGFVNFYSTCPMFGRKIWQKAFVVTFSPSPMAQGGKYLDS